MTQEEKEKQLQEQLEKNAKAAKINLDDSGLKSAYDSYLMKNSPYAGIHGQQSEQKFYNSLDDEKKYASLSEKIIIPAIKGNLGPNPAYIQQTAFQIYVESLGSLKVSDLVSRFGYKGPIDEKLKNAYVGQLGKDPSENPLLKYVIDYAVEDVAIEMSKENKKLIGKGLEGIVKPQEEEKESSE